MFCRSITFNFFTNYSIYSKESIESTLRSVEPTLLNVCSLLSLFLLSSNKTEFRAIEMKSSNPRKRFSKFSKKSRLVLNSLSFGVNDLMSASLKQSEGRVHSKTTEKVRLIFGLVCSLVLFYQSFHLIRNYTKFETTIMIETNDREEVIEFPAISVCERFPQIEITIPNRTVDTRLPFPQIIAFLNMSWKQTQDGLMKVDFEHVLQKEPQILKMKTNNSMEMSFYPFRDDSVKCVATILERDCHPRYYSMCPLAQCRTYFGEIDSFGRVVSKVTKKIASTLEDNIDNLAFFAINFTDINRGKELVSDKEVFVMIHPQNEAPSDKTVPFASRRYLVKANRSYELSFSKKKFIRLPFPYNTDCIHYDPRINSTDIYNLSRQMCLSRCRKDAVHQRFGCLQPNIDFIYGQIYGKYKICEPTISLNLSGIHAFDWIVQRECYHICKPDCVKETFNVEMAEVDIEAHMRKEFKLGPNDFDLGYVTVLTNHLTQLTYHHLPRMLLIDFLCSLGGLFSLWLGLSVISLYDFTVAIGSAVHSKLKLC